MIADEGGQEQSCELIADRLLQANDSGRAHVLDAVQARAVLEDESEATGRLRCGVHNPAIGDCRRAFDPSRE